jgi:hypothetical protein
LAASRPRERQDATSIEARGIFDAARMSGAFEDPVFGAGHRAPVPSCGGE